MIAYLDTSALIKLLVAEPGSEDARAMFEAAEIQATCQLGYVEARSALARMRKGRRLTAHGAADRVAELERIWADLATVPADDDLVATAAELARGHALRAYDAIHLAAGLALVDATTLSFVCFDTELREAAAGEGLTVEPAGEAL